ncbi:MAG: TolC family protein [Acidobacteriota bacterium]
MLLSPPTGWAQDPLRLDLAAVVARALEASPALGVARARRAEIEGSVTEVAADAWPQVDFVAGWSRSRDPSFLVSADFDDIVELFPGFEPEEQEAWTTGVELRQTLYSGGKVRAAVELAEIAVEVADERLAETRLDVAMTAAEAFYELAAAERSVAILDAERAARDAALEVVEARLEIGEATRLEQLRALAARDEVAPRLAEAEGRIEIARVRLRAALALEPDAPVALEAPIVGRDDGPTVDTLAVETLGVEDVVSSAPPLDVLRAEARRGRPALRDLALQIAAIERERTVEAAEGKPQVDFTGAYGRRGRTLDQLPDALYDEWRVGAGVTWSLFDGGRRRGLLAQIDARGEALRWRLEELEREIDADLATRRAAHQAARERLRASAVAATAAREAVRVADASYRQGVALQADLLDARERSTRAELAVDDALFDALRAGARLRRAVGLLPTEEWSQ